MSAPAATATGPAPAAAPPPASAPAATTAPRPPVSQEAAAAAAAAGAAPAAAAPETADPDQHEREVAEREAYEYWGYLFNADRTGTDKLKSLLRGIKVVMSQTYNPSDQPDLLPSQLASFYRDMHGDYDQLFLDTPHESIAFIYKSLGCLHSLQPQAVTHSSGFSDPTVPALKTEGWILWQTIQLLLGPAEHSGFLIEALRKLDVTDPATGKAFPKILPRRCFPSEPDKHMVSWYEGVSERLKREADDEQAEKQRMIEAEREDLRRPHERKPLVRYDDRLDDEVSIDSKGPALAYFRNPLYRHVDGRPSIVRSASSKRPPISPRPPTMMGRGKEAATTVGHVIRNIGSPHLWDGRGSHSRRPSSGDKDKERRRRSLPDHRHSHLHTSSASPAPPGSGDDLSAPDQRRHHHRRSVQLDSSPDDEEWDADESSAHYSPRPSPHYGRASTHQSPGSSRLRQSRSHEPTPSQREYTDYFQGYDDPNRRRNSAYGSATGTPAASGNSLPAGAGGGGFGPSAGPLFATHVSRHHQPPLPIPPSVHPPAPGPPRMSSADPYAPRRSSSARRPHMAPVDADRWPDRREYDDRRRYDSPRRPRFEHNPADYDYDDVPPRPGTGSRPSSRSFDDPRPYPPSYGPPPDARRRSARMSGADVPYGAADDLRRIDSRSNPPKLTRFADRHGSPPPSAPAAKPPPPRGVDGRRYADASPWR